MRPDIRRSFYIREPLGTSSETDGDIGKPHPKYPVSAFVVKRQGQRPHLSVIVPGGDAGGFGVSALAVDPLRNASGTVDEQFVDIPWGVAFISRVFIIIPKDEV